MRHARISKPGVDGTQSIAHEECMGVRSGKRWSQRVTEQSDALDLEPGVFTLDDPRAIARSLKLSAERSSRRKTDPFPSAMSMLTFYINRAGHGLSQQQRARLEAAKDELRELFGRPRRSGTAATRRSGGGSAA